MKTAAFDFLLPSERIAQQPLEPRDSARLLRVLPDALQDRHVYDLSDLLRPDDVLVLNDTKVIPARLYGMRGCVRIEILLHKQESVDFWRAFARPAKRLKTGDTIFFAPDFTATVQAKSESGDVVLLLPYPDLFSKLSVYGEPPLPPYIKRAGSSARADSARYQTVYAAREGAVAAPTAGLHFTPELLKKLAVKGIEQHRVTLHVGAGTFLPVKVEDTQAHVMHAEWGEIAPETAAALNRAKSAGRRIVAVGTTSLRVLESAADAQGTIHPFAQDTAIFITPGYRFRAVDALLTNFHLPQSTLFMLVSAFMGLERMKEAYAHAIETGYRFYSYGDASLLER